MAVAKNRGAITQLTASGTSTTIDLSLIYTAVLFVKHFNGTGTVTTAASFLVQYQAKGGTLWYTLNNQAFTPSAITGKTDDFTIFIPDGTGAVQLVYTAPAGPTGFTLDAEAGEITGL